MEAHHCEQQEHIEHESSHICKIGQGMNQRLDQLFHARYHVDTLERTEHTCDTQRLQFHRAESNLKDTIKY